MKIPLLACLTALTATPLALAVEVPPAVDLNPDPDVFETVMTAEVTTVDLDGNGMMVECWTFNGSLPGPEIRVKVGDTVIVHLENELEFPTSIHWHGVEVGNAADGTSVTQAPVMPGQTFTYRFIAPRPGVFYYHPHMRPMNQVWKGMYGSVIVEEDAEATLTKLGVLPERDMTLVLSDVTVARPEGQNDDLTFPEDPTLPWSGPFDFPGNGFSPSPADLIENLPRTYLGLPSGGPPVAAGTIPFIAPARECRDLFEIPCRTNEGQMVLGNGRLPASRAGSPQAPGAVVPSADAVVIPSGSGIRLRLLNAAVQRFFRLRATDGSGNLLPLYRVGGEGGLLDEARLEGGIQGEYDTKFALGEIVLGASQRADVVLIANAPEGDVITIWERDVERVGFGFSQTPTVPVMHFIVGPAGEATMITEGTPLRTHPEVDDPVERLADLPADATLVDPSTLVAPQPGSTDLVIRLTNQVPGSAPYPSIDNVRGAFEGGGPPPVPYISTTRWARVGDLLELTVLNETSAHHPWHHHGFSFQPLRLENQGGGVLMEYPTEFVDVIDVPPGLQVVYRIRLDDRPQSDGVTMGGAIGRWLFHCHLFHHALLGMITELVVLPPCSGDANADGVVDAADIAVLLSLWNTRAAAGDMNFDGTVDAVDLGLLLGNWGACEP